MQYARDIREGIGNARFADKWRYLETFEMRLNAKDGRSSAKRILGTWK